MQKLSKYLNPYKPKIAFLMPLILVYMTMGIMVFMDMPQVQTCSDRIRQVMECRKDGSRE